MISQGKIVIMDIETLGAAQIRKNARSCACFLAST